MRKFLFILIGLISLQGMAQNFYTLRGYVYNEDNQGMPAVYLRVQNTSSGTITDNYGRFELRLPEGLNRVIVSCLGYESQTIEVVMQQDEVKNIWLKSDVNQIQGIEIKNRKKDISYEIIRKVIDHKDSFRNTYSSLKYAVYIKSTEDIISTGNDKPDEESVLDSLGIPKKPRMNLYEARIIRHEGENEQYKEEKVAAELRGSQQTLFYKSTTDGDFDLYQNLLVIRTLGDNSYVSPLSSTAFLSYKFKLLSSYYIGLQKIYKIKVIPRKLGNALFSGELEVYDSLWTLKSVSLELPKRSLVIYNDFNFRQEYGFIEGHWLVLSQEFNWKLKLKDERIEGKSVVKHSNFVFDTTYAKRFFGAELGKTADDAYDKDTQFWSSIRPEPLTIKEQEFVRYSDSLKMVMNSKEYLDSIDSVYNKVTVLNLLWWGQGHINREKKSEWEIAPLVNVLDPLAIGGWRLRYFGRYYKRFENRKTFVISPFINYGIKNRDIKGNLFLGTLYDPKKQALVNLSVGRYFDFVNNFATIADILRRDNFYVQNYVTLNHRKELFNGFYLLNILNFIEREDLSDFKFASAGDSLFENNVPVTFRENRTVEFGISIEYTPKQLYIMEPLQKIVLGSRYPTFTLNYKQAIPGLLGSTNKYSYLEISMRQLFNIGVIGTSEYMISSGKFFDTSELQIMDYKYQRGGDPYLFTPALYTFQLIKKTFPTFDWFLEAHYVHQFNGFIGSKIPGMRQLEIKTMAGGGFLYVPELHYQYSEIYFGMNRIFRIGRERLRLGAYYVFAQSNTFGLDSGFKISVEFYDQDRNTWSF